RSPCQATAAEGCWEGVRCECGPYVSGQVLSRRSLGRRRQTNGIDSGPWGLAPLATARWRPSGATATDDGTDARPALCQNLLHHFAAIDERHGPAVRIGDRAFDVDAQQVIRGTQDVLGADREILHERPLAIAGAD